MFVIRANKEPDDPFSLGLGNGEGNKKLSYFFLRTNVLEIFIGV